MTHREEREKIEEQFLSPYAIHAKQSKGRTLHGDEQDDYRTVFQRDRDRVLYSKAFRDLQYKTQVFLINEGDFYRTRLTHTLEVAQHARTLARVLRLNEDLCEAIAYAHDLGHPPFGHAGEAALDELLQDDGGFEHNMQSLRVVDTLEKRYARYDGLNLTFETREGIAKHQSTYDHPAPHEGFLATPSPSMETQVVNIADPLAYCAHDLEDALGAGIISFAEIAKMDNDFLREALAKCQSKFPDFTSGSVLLKSRLLVREIIEQTTLLVIEQTQKNIVNNNIATANDVLANKTAIVQLPATQMEQFAKLKKYLLENVYQTPQVCIMNEKGKMIITRLFTHLVQNPQMLPHSWKTQYDDLHDAQTRRRLIADYIALMTDQYASLLYQMMFAPTEKIMFNFQS
ncbi:MAG: deoxyguanosinetriphosphate triphosphohydrolase [Deltaproteobacteria bacterium]|nr:deoxyguanosinetriphosphate triphosphohydrolase [Deltaproteobacteria bacterium]